MSDLEQGQPSNLVSQVTPPKQGEHWACEDEPPCCECESEGHCCHDCPTFGGPEDSKEGGQ